MLRRMLDVREELEDPLDWSLYFGETFTFAIVNLPGGCDSRQDMWTRMQRVDDSFVAVPLRGIS
jgi:hypothetical protein